MITMDTPQVSYLGDVVDVELVSQPSSPYAKPTALAIGPNGEMAIRHMDPRVEALGDHPIASNGGRPMIQADYADRGWVLYDDLCRGRVQGVAPDHDALKRWQALCKIRAAGRELPRGTIDDVAFWHAEVARRREAAAAGRGSGTLTLDQIRALLPGVALIDDEDDGT